MRDIERIISKKFIVGEMPTAAGICQKQLIKVIDDLEKVKVNEEEIADFMPEIYRKLEWLSKEDLIKRMVSHEFNRFAEYYRNRAEIEVPTDIRGERTGRSDRKEGGFEKRSRQAAPGFNRLFINLGKTDSFFPSDLIGLLNSNTRGRIELGRIDLMQNYSFFEVPEKEATNVIKALNRAKWNGRKVVVEIAAAKATNVHRAMRIRIENRKMLLQKTQSQQKKISLVVLIGDTLMLAVRRRKMTGKSFLKIKSRISVKKDGLAENLRRNKTYHIKNELLLGGSF